MNSFDVGYREIIDGEEVPILRMSFTPVDYFTVRVTDLDIGNPVRERLAGRVDVTKNPVPEFATILGVNIGLVTKDGCFIVTKRSHRVASGAGKYHCSLHEHILRPTDTNGEGVPDPFRTASRAAMEELVGHLAIR